MHRKLSKKDSHKLIMTAGYETTIMFCVRVEQENNKVLNIINSL